jgi:hypothetical protein
MRAKLVGKKHFLLFKILSLAQILSWYNRSFTLAKFLVKPSATATWDSYVTVTTVFALATLGGVT